VVPAVRVLSEVAGISSVTRMWKSVVVAGLVVLGVPGPAYAGEAFDPAAVDRVVTDFADQAGYPGLAVAITKGDRALHMGGYGHDSSAAAVVRARAATLATEPGTKHAYTNTNYHLAARLVEVVAGEPFARYLRRQVLEPAGMRASTTINLAPGGVRKGHIYAYGASIPAVEPMRFVGGSDGQIARRLDIVEGTVKGHVSAILTRLDLDNRVQAAVLAHEAGLVPE
jgi:CubicO group peptidase (beta-lactamase class C family)